MVLLYIELVSHFMKKFNFNNKILLIKLLKLTLFARGLVILQDKTFRHLRMLVWDISRISTQNNILTYFSRDLDAW